MINDSTSLPGLFLSAALTVIFAGGWYATRHDDTSFWRGVGIVGTLVFGLIFLMLLAGYWTDRRSAAEARIIYAETGKLSAQAQLAASVRGMGIVDREVFYAAINVEVAPDPEPVITLEHPRGGSVDVPTAWARWYVSAMRDGSQLPAVSQWADGSIERRRAEALVNWLAGLGHVEGASGRAFTVLDIAAVRKAIG